MDYFLKDAYLRSYVLNHHELFEKVGKEHYELLIYLSTLFNNSNIIDIGTHRGFSALCLSYNDSNVVHSFDILNKIQIASIYKKKNIKYYINDLWKDKTYHDLVLNAPLIFLDVDPHNGEMEFEFYNFLVKNNYRGILVCDDIHYFKPMKILFWDKIPDEKKYDITKYGHWSGTGIIFFNEEDKYIISNLERTFK